MDVTIPLDSDLSAYVESQVESGRFSSKGDVIREALLRSAPSTWKGPTLTTSFVPPGKRVSTAATPARSTSMS